MSLNVKLVLLVSYWLVKKYIYVYLRLDTTIIHNSKYYTSK